jgi:hypothetical protein
MGRGFHKKINACRISTKYQYFLDGIHRGTRCRGHRVKWTVETEKEDEEEKKKEKKEKKKWICTSVKIAKLK